MKQNYHILGVMSGTSLDGIDLAEVFFDYSETKGWNFKFGVTQTIAYPALWKAELESAISKSTAALKP